MDQQTKVNEMLPSQGNMINELFAQNYAASLRTAYAILRSKEDAEDAVQTAYRAAFRGFSKFRGELSFKTWITRITVNCCLIQLREHRARPLVALDNLLRPLESHAATPEMLGYLRELQVAHTRAASRLPESLHDVYVHSVMRNTAFPAVAHRLSLTRAAAKPRLFRARRRSKTLFSQWSGKGGVMNQPRPSAGVWGVLLAGGNGTRLQSLTTRIEGDTRPKQFCRIFGDESLLTQIRRRIRPLFDPDRIVAVVTKKHEGFYSL
jgi:RNA polymerase sigma-70 factor, ECF subfamily